MPKPFDYGQIGVGGRKIDVTHRVAYKLAKGEIPDGLVVRHSCDNPPCVNPDHLLVGTFADNSGDMVDRGRSTKGRGIKLTDDDVREIRRRFTRRAPGQKCNRQELAAEFGVHPQHITDLVSGKERGYVKS